MKVVPPKNVFLSETPVIGGLADRTPLDHNVQPVGTVRQGGMTHHYAIVLGGGAQKLHRMFRRHLFLFPIAAVTLPTVTFFCDNHNLFVTVCDYHSLFVTVCVHTPARLAKPEWVRCQPKMVFVLEATPNMNSFELQYELI